MMSSFILLASKHFCSFYFSYICMPWLWKTHQTGCARKESWHILRHDANIHLKRMRKLMSQWHASGRN